MSNHVMAGLVPAIHVFFIPPRQEGGEPGLPASPGGVITRAPTPTTPYEASSDLPARGRYAESLAAGPLPTRALFANQRHDGPSGQGAHRRLRRPIHPAHRAAGAGSGRLFGDRAL